MLKERFKTELIAISKLAFPIVIAQLGVILMGVTDNIMVGRFLGKVALGAAGIANTIAFLIASLAVGGMSVVAPMVSKCSAENDTDGIKSLYSSTLWVSFIFSIVLSILGLLAYKYFYLYQQPAAINQASPSFLIIILASNIPLYFFLAIKQFSDGLSKPKVAMVITILGLITNIIGNLIFINGFGPIKALGLNGSALATLITRILMVFTLFLYLRFASKFRLYFGRVSLVFNVKTIKEILKRSIPGGSQFFFEIAAFSVAVIMMGWISETALAAHQIAINIASTTYMMATGISVAAAIRVGEAWGQRSPKGIRISGNAGYLLVVIFMTTMMILILLFDTTLLSVYINDADVIKHAIPLLTIAAFFQLSDGVQVVGLGALRGLADIKLPTIITFVAYWVIAIPLGAYLGFSLKMGSVGIWLGLLVGLTVSAFLLYFRFRKLTRTQSLITRFRVN
jgi:multidrug resistance protein, MATE family